MRQPASLPPTAVEDLEGVERLQGLERLHQVHPHHALVDVLPPRPVPPDLALQVLEAAVLHHHAQVQRVARVPAAVQERLVQPHDARVPEGRQQPDLELIGPINSGKRRW